MLIRAIRACDYANPHCPCCPISTLTCHHYLISKAQGRLHFDLTSGGYQFQSDPLPIGALYLLGEQSADPNAPRVEPVSPLDGIMGIVANTYGTRFLDRSMRAHELQQLSHLVNQCDGAQGVSTPRAFPPRNALQGHPGRCRRPRIKSASGVMIYYRVYGLTFRSDCELPGLDRIRNTSVVDYSLRFDDGANRFEMLRRELRRPWYISARRVKRGQTVVEVWRTENCRKFLFHFYDGVEFIIDRRREEIWVGGLRRTSPQSVTCHLVYSLPGFLLGLRKSACLHGAVNRVGRERYSLAR